MNKEKLATAISEAQRFVERAKQLQDYTKRDCAEPKDNSAVRRASMDLTRALADLRKR